MSKYVTKKYYTADELAYNATKTILDALEGYQTLIDGGDIDAAENGLSEVEEFIESIHDEIAETKEDIKKENDSLIEQGLA